MNHAELRHVIADIREFGPAEAPLPIAELEPDFLSRNIVPVMSYSIKAFGEAVAGINAWIAVGLNWMLHQYELAEPPEHYLMPVNWDFVNPPDRDTQSVYLNFRKPLDL